MFPEIHRAALCTDIIEPAAIGLPQWPSDTALGGQHFLEPLAFQIVKPNLTRLGTLVALTPPCLAFPREEQTLAVRRKHAVGSVIVEEHLLGFAFLGIDEEKAGCMPPVVIPAAADQELPAVRSPAIHAVPRGVKRPLFRRAAVRRHDIHLVAAFTVADER